MMHTCAAAAGLCPKAEHTHGEPHYCNKPLGHDGSDHQCRVCDMPFNVDSSAPCLNAHEAAQNQRKRADGDSR